MSHKNPFSIHCFSIIFLLILPLCSSFCVDMYLPAYADIAHSFTVAEREMPLTMSVFLFGLAIGQIVYGFLSDKFGRRNCLLVGVLLFVLSSVGCGLATSFILLLLMRFVQALGVCSTVVLTRAIIKDRFSHKQVTTMLGLVMACNIFSPTIAPLVGGFIVSKFFWQLIFFILAGYGICMWIGVKIFLFETLPYHARNNLSGQMFLQNLRRVVECNEFLICLCIIALLYALVFVWIYEAPVILTHGFHVDKQHFGFYFMLPAIGDMLGALTIANVTRICRDNVTIYFGLFIMAIGIGNLLFSELLHLNYIPIVFILSVMIIYFAFGMLSPLLLSLALRKFSDIVGFTAGLIGFIQIVAGSLIGIICSVFYNYAVVTMTNLMAILFFMVIAIMICNYPKNSSCHAVDSTTS